MVMLSYSIAGNFLMLNLSFFALSSLGTGIYLKKQYQLQLLFNGLLGLEYIQMEVKLFSTYMFIAFVTLYILNVKLKNASNK